MTQRISTRPLTEKEWEEIDEILSDELEIQVWFGVLFIPGADDELLVAVQ